MDLAQRRYNMLNQQTFINNFKLSLTIQKLSAESLFRSSLISRGAEFSLAISQSNLGSVPLEKYSVDAASLGHLEAIKQIYLNGFPLTPKMLWSAIEHNQLDCVQYMCTCSQDIAQEDMIIFGIKNKRIEIVKIIYPTCKQNYPKGWTNNFLLESVLSQSSELIKFFSDNNESWSNLDSVTLEGISKITTATKIAIEQNYSECAEFLIPKYLDIPGHNWASLTSQVNVFKHADIFKIARKNDLSFNDDEFYTQASLSTFISYSLIRCEERMWEYIQNEYYPIMKYNRLDCLEYWYEQHPLYSKKFYQIAGKTHSLASLEFLIRKDLTEANYALLSMMLIENQFCQDSETYYNLQKSIQYLKENYEFDAQRVFEQQASQGNYDIITTLHGKFQLEKDLVLLRALVSGDKLCIWSLKHHGFKLDDDTTEKIAGKEPVSVMKIAVHNGAKLSLTTLINAIVGNNQECIDYLVSLEKSGIAIRHALKQYLSQKENPFEFFQKYSHHLRYTFEKTQLLMQIIQEGRINFEVCEKFIPLHSVSLFFRELIASCDKYKLSKIIGCKGQKTILSFFRDRGFVPCLKTVWFYAARYDHCELFKHVSQELSIEERDKLCIENIRELLRVTCSHKIYRQIIKYITLEGKRILYSNPHAREILQLFAEEVGPTEQKNYIIYMHQYGFPLTELEQKQKEAFCGNPLKSLVEHNIPKCKYCLQRLLESIMNSFRQIKTRVKNDCGLDVNLAEIRQMTTEKIREFETKHLRRFIKRPCNFKFSCFPKFRNIFPLYDQFLLEITLFLIPRIKQHIQQYMTTECTNAAITKAYNMIVMNNDIEHSPVDCPICLEDILPIVHKYGVLQCGHYFHADCLSKYLKTKANCPMCREPRHSLIEF